MCKAANKTTKSPVTTAAMRAQIGSPSPPLDDAWVALLLHSCLDEPTTNPDLRTTLLAPLDHPNEAARVPLYKHLAKALRACTEASAPSCTIFQLVTTLKELTSCINFRLQVQEPFFSQLKDGSKVIEGRCAAGAYNSILPGDALLFNNTLSVTVKSVKHYSSFYELLEIEGMDRVLPGVTSIKEGVAIYRKFYTEEMELSRGVLAIQVEHGSEEREPLTIARTILTILGYKTSEAGFKYVLMELATCSIKALRGFVMKVIINES